MGLSSVLVRRRKKGGGEISTTEAEDDAVAAAGLRIVIVEVDDDDEYSNKIVVRRSGLKPLTNNKDNGGFNCFLKSCHLCRKPLSPHKDVYMYRGDQGFCSIECRSRQIMVDEIKVKEDDEIRKRRLQDYCVGCETCTLLRDFRKHQYLLNTTHKYYKSPNNDAFIISPAKHHQPLLSFS